MEWSFGGPLLSFPCNAGITPSGDFDNTYPPWIEFPVGTLPCGNLQGTANDRREDCPISATLSLTWPTKFLFDSVVYLVLLETVACPSRSCWN
jgi:hypothetical protein